MIIINASNLLVGRLASFAAKKALNGETVKVINCENAYISGGKKEIIESYKQKREMGTHSTGPFFPRYADRLVKRTIRGMLPFKNARGKEAFARVKCYIGVPDDLKNEKPITISNADIQKLPNIKFMSLNTLTKHLGAKVE
ncbi:MAG: 50S ribosomal protein L13 [archaeon]